MKKVLSAVLVLFTLSVFAQEKIYTPTLVVPVDSATNQKVNVLLDWNPVSGADHYEIQIDTNAGFSNPTGFTSTYSAIGTNELLFGEFFNWRVRAIDASGDSSAWSASRVFETVYMPTLLSPEDSAMTQAVSPTMEITLLSGVTTYEWEFDSVSTFDSPWLKTDTFMNGYEFKTIRNLYGDRYFWRVRGIHSNDTSSWSDAFSFVTQDSIGLQYPISGTIDYHPVDSIVFYSVFGTTSYQIAFDIDSLFPSPIYQLLDSSAFYIKLSNHDTLAHSFIDTVDFGTKYFWKARLINPNDTSKWSNIFNFTTIEKVTLTSPADASIDVLVTSSFDWTAIRGSDFYILEYDTAASFSNPTKVDVSGATTYTPSSNLLSQTNYYWRVRAANAKDTTDVYDEYTFKTYFGVGIDESAQAQWNIYPNPAYDFINVNIDGSSYATAEIINILGDVVINQKSLRNGNNVITLSELEPGIYMIRLLIDEEIITSRIVKK